MSEKRNSRSSKVPSTYDDCPGTIDSREKNMPIPAFDGILNVLPPHLGDPTQPGDLSPYVCTTEELCQRFATSPPRKTILDGFLRFRQELVQLGIQGFHWLDGSFLEDIEAQEARDPRDIDVVTFIAQPCIEAEVVAAFDKNLGLLDRSAVKNTYHVDHLPIPLCSKPELIVEITRCYYGLFSHRRDYTWKGMLRIQLAANADDSPAWQILGSNP